MPALTRASRANDSKLTESTPWLRRLAAPAGGYVEPSRTLSPTSTRIGSPMLPIIEKHDPGFKLRDDRKPLYPFSPHATEAHPASRRPSRHLPGTWRLPSEDVSSGPWTDPKKGARLSGKVACKF